MTTTLHLTEQVAFQFRGSLKFKDFIVEASIGKNDNTEAVLVEVHDWIKE